MTPQDYHKAYSRTLACPRTIDLVHAGVGMATEIIELEQATDRINLCEELGDLHWYNELAVDVVMRTSAKSRGVDAYLAYPDYLGGKDPVQTARYAVGEILDVGKRVMWYGLDLEADSGRLLNRLITNHLIVRSAIGEICRVNKIDIALIRERNICKLYKRNPGAFDGFSFVIRDYQAERNFFENI